MPCSLPGCLRSLFRPARLRTWAGPRPRAAKTGEKTRVPLLSSASSSSLAFRERKEEEASPAALSERGEDVSETAEEEEERCSGRARTPRSCERIV